MTFFQTQIMEFARQNRDVLLFLPILSIFSIADITVASFSRSVPLVAIGSVILLGILALLSYRRIKFTKLKSPAECRQFFPFFGDLEQSQRDRFLLSRSVQLDGLRRAIASSNKHFLIVAGNSGVGKSTLAHLYRSSDTIGNSIFISESTDHVSDIVKSASRLKGLSNDPGIDQSLGAVIASPTLDAEGQAMHALAATLFIGASTATQPFAIFIDQAERIGGLSGQEPDLATGKLFRFLNVLAKMEQVRVIFMVRSDRLSGVLERVISYPYHLHFVYGIDSKVDIATRRDVQNRFQRIGVAEHEFLKYERLCTRDGSTNTFAIQLCGYILESNGSSYIAERGRVFDDYRAIVASYFNMILEEYAYINRDANRAADIEIVLFTLAYCNRSYNRAVSPRQISALAHVPIRRIEAAVRYMLDLKMVEKSEEIQDGIRLAHDILIDYAIAREAEFLRLDHKNAISILVDREIQHEHLVEVKEETDPLAKPLRAYEDGTPSIDGISTYLLWIAAIIYWARIAYPEVCYNILAPVNALIVSYIGDVVLDPVMSTWFFFGTGFIQYLWVLFMFGMDTGFLRYLYKRGDLSVCLYGLIHISGPVGAAMGFALSFAPALFIIPIAIPGCLLCAVYLSLYKNARNKSALISRYYLELGATTAFNMIICLTACAGMVILMHGRNNTMSMRNIAVVAIVCALFGYFNYMMRGRQGSRLGRSSMLAIYDAGYLRP